jgi:starch synthase
MVPNPRSRQTNVTKPGDAMAKARPHVLLIGSEARPFSKTGGLADVLGALPPALAHLGWDVTLALPRYRGVTAGSLVERFSVTVGGYAREIGFFETALAEGARAVLVDCPELFDREGLYGFDSGDYPDNPRRFAMLVRAALEFAGRRGTGPSIVHAHDWQAALAPVYLKTLYASHPVLGGTATIFTIHNLAFQGIFDSDWLPRLDLGWDQFTTDRLEYWHRISFMKGAIVYAETITTVSSRYAREIQTPELGFGFDGILRTRAADVVGILNGIDTREWDPAHDRFLPRPYSMEDLTGKSAVKEALLAEYGLPATEESLKRPVVGMVSRMVDQKGFDLIAALSHDLPRLDATFAILGTGEPRYQDLWTALAARYPDRIGARIGFDERLAHLIEGGADIFLMPSQFEPCGLNQMYSLKYGTVPVVREVGGLADTVTPRNGFLFREYTPEALLNALTRALAAYGNRRKWRALQLAGMREDHSWDRSAREYVKIYERALKRTARPRGRARGATAREAAAARG